MADEDAPAERTQAPTQYVVLQRIALTTDGFKPEELPPGYRDREPAAADLVAWVPFVASDGQPAVYEARSNREACRAATKLPDDDSRHRPGSYKAVPLRSWRGGARFRDQTKTVTVTDELED